MKFFTFHQAIKAITGVFFGAVEAVRYIDHNFSSCRKFILPLMEWTSTLVSIMKRHPEVPIFFIGDKMLLSRSLYPFKFLLIQ